MYIKKLFLPKLPDAIVSEVHSSIEQGVNRAWEGERAKHKLDMYAWIPANDAVQDWCRTNISPDLYWGVQVIDANLPMHKDHGTEIKFNYIIDQGGSNPITTYYDDNEVVIDSYTMELNSWYILNVAANHGVTGIIPGERRISITSRIIP